MKKIFQDIWKEALFYQDKRDDKGHAKIVRDYAVKLSKLENANENITVPAAILHDIGWSQVSKDEIAIIFDLNANREEEKAVRIKHEKQGKELAKKILQKVEYNSKLIPKILEIIDGHDTRRGFLNKEEGIVRDADKLWRYSKKGFWLDVKRLNNSAEEQCQIPPNKLSGL